MPRERSEHHTAPLEAKPVDIFVQKKELFDKIQKMKGLPGYGYFRLLSRVAGNSVEDSLLLVDQAELTSREMYRVFFNDSFIVKHPELIQAVLDKMQDALGTDEPPNKAIQRSMEYMSERLAYHDSLIKKDLPLPDAVKPFSIEEKGVIQEIDAFYSRLLGQRQVKDKTRLEQGTKRSGMDIAEEYLENYGDSVDKYYTGPLREFMVKRAMATIPEKDPDNFSPLNKSADDFEKALKERGEFMGEESVSIIKSIVGGDQKQGYTKGYIEDIFNPFFQQSLIKGENVSKAFHLLGIDKGILTSGTSDTVRDDEAIRTLEKAKYHMSTLIADTRAASARKRLTHEIKNLLRVEGHQFDDIRFVWSEKEKAMKLVVDTPTLIEELEKSNPAIQERLALLGFMERYAKKVEDPARVMYDYERYQLHRRLAGNKVKKGEGKIGAIVNAVNDLLRTDAGLFLNTVSATRDRTDEAFVEQLTFKIFPELKQLHEIKENQKKREAWAQVPVWQKALALLGLNREKKSGADKKMVAGEVFGYTETPPTLRDADPREKGSEMMRFREKPPHLIVSDMYGKYVRETGKWERIQLPVTPDLREPVREYTCVLPPVKGVTEVDLWPMVNAQIMPERVKSIDRKRKEQLLTIETKPDGRIVAKVNLDDERKITYTQRVSALPPTVTEMSKKEYKLFLDSFKISSPEKISALIEDVAALPEEWLIFLQSIKAQPPHEQVMAIEEFVRTLGYYDMDNGEMKGEKVDRPLEEIFSTMRSRYDQLRAEGRLQNSSEKQQYAGVCIDFNRITLALLRKAGFASGILVGPRPQDKVVTTKEMHGTAFVIWPGEKPGDFQVIPVDGTPAVGMSPELRDLLQLPSLRDRLAELKKLLGQLLKTSKETLQKILAVVQGKNTEAIRELQNGELEETLNVILEHEVKQSHAEIIHGMFNFMQYFPGKISSAEDLQDPEKRSIFLTYMFYEVKRLREEEKKNGPQPTPPAGSLLMDEVRETAARLSKQSLRPDTTYVYDLMESAVDVCKDYLDPVERRGVTAVITYLRAKQMVRK